MKKVSGVSLLLAFAIGIILFACSSDEPVPGTSSDSGDHQEDSSDSNNNNDDSSDSGNHQEDSSDSSEPPDEESSSSANKSSSSSSRSSSSSAVASSSSAATASSSSSKIASSSSSVSTTPTCAYKSSWCEGTEFSNVATASLDNATGSHGICTFATSVAMLGNANNLSVNGTKTDRCGNSGWGQKACTEVLASVPKADGGYYIYEQNYYADFTVTGGTPNCNGSANPGTSSSSSKPSSSSAGSTGGNSSSSSNNSSGGTPSYTPTAPGNQSGQTTQYWDACKPSCSWSGKGGKQANACNITGGNIGHNDSDKSACDGGTAFACMNQAPWKVGNVSFGFVAVNDGACGDCYQLDFPNGEVMVVMKTNIGGINGKFDIMIPGGGVGDFDALTRQIQQSGVSNPDMGERYGGFRGKCGWEYSAQSVNCVKQKCEEVFKNLPDLKAGCLWYANTLGTDNASWNNPNVKYKQVTCPKELTDKY